MSSQLRGVLLQSMLTFILLIAMQPLQAQAVLQAHPGPSDNGGAFNSALLFDLQPGTGVVITGFTTASDRAPAATFTVNVYTRAGTALGGPVGSGPGSSMAGWRLHATVIATQGSGEISLPIRIPDLVIAAGQLQGIALQSPDAQMQYLGSGTSMVSTYSNADLTLITGDARSAPFTTGGAFFSSRQLIGSVLYRLADAALPANPGPTDNGGSINSGVFFDLQSSTGAVITGMTTASTAAVDSTFLIDVYTRPGTALGNVTGSGPATSSAGWTLQGTVTAHQGVGDVSQPIALPNLTVTPGSILGVGLVYRNAGPRYAGTGSTPLGVFGNTDLTLVTGQAMTVPFTNTSSVFSSRALVGTLYWQPIGQSLAAHPGPSNNGGANNSGMFMDLEAVRDVTITALSVAHEPVAASNLTLQVYTRAGSTLGGSATTGPTSSSAGWTLHANVQGSLGATGVMSLPIHIPPLAVAAGQTVGVGLVFVGAAPKYVGMGTQPLGVYSDPNLILVTGEARSAPFTTSGTFFSSRELLGKIFYRADTVFEDGFE